MPKTPPTNEGWFVGTTEVGFDGVWSQPHEVVAVYHDGKVVKVYSVWWGAFLADILARLYVLRHR